VKYERILVISDMHQPYSHPDLIAFLKEIKNKFKPDCVVCIGDEIDGHSISFHDHNPDLDNAGREFRQAIKGLSNVYALFPKVFIVDSNHGSLVYRRAIASGLPHGVIKSYRDMLEAPKGWVWSDDLVLYASNNQQIYFHHSRGSDVLKVSQQMGMSVVQGHSHSQFEIRYWSNPNHLHFGMTVGCLINNKSLAFAYNKLQVKRPIIGCGIIIDGQPKLLPMVLNKNGRWIKKLV